MTHDAMAVDYELGTAWSDASAGSAWTGSGGSGWRWKWWLTTRWHSMTNWGRR